MGEPRAPAQRADDESLVAAVRRGNDEAFDRIHDRHATELLAFCRRSLVSRHDAEDALQQTFLKAYRALRASDGPIVLRPWLFTIARNECISFVRARRNSAADPAEAGAVGGCVVSEVEQREDLRATLSDVERLPAKQRAALLHSSFDSASGDQIASALDTDRDHVKALVFRARRSLVQSRDARGKSCVEIRAQLTALSGGSLRRTVLREHLIACAGCREFRIELRASAGAGAGSRVQARVGQPG